MKRMWLLAAAGAAAALFVLASWSSGPPGPGEIERQLLAHPEMVGYNRSTAGPLLLDAESLADLAAGQPAIYGNLSSPGPLYRVEVAGPGGGALVLYDAASDRILRVFSLFEGRLG